MISMNLKEKKKHELHEWVREMHFNQGLPVKALAAHFGKSERTIYRWLKQESSGGHINTQKSKKTYYRPKKYPPEIFNRIVKLKEEVPQRSTPMIHRKIQEEFKDN